MHNGTYMEHIIRLLFTLCCAILEVLPKKVLQIESIALLWHQTPFSDDPGYNLCGCDVKCWVPYLHATTIVRTLVLAASHYKSARKETCLIVKSYQAKYPTSYYYTQDIPITNGFLLTSREILTGCITSTAQTANDEASHACYTQCRSLRKLNCSHKQ